MLKEFFQTIKSKWFQFGQKRNELQDSNLEKKALLNEFKALKKLAAQMPAVSPMHKKENFRLLLLRRLNEKAMPKPILGCGVHEMEIVNSWEERAWLLANGWGFSDQAKDEYKQALIFTTDIKDNSLAELMLIADLRSYAGTHSQEDSDAYRRELCSKMLGVCTWCGCDGNVDFARTLIQMGADVNYVMNSNQTILEKAVWNEKLPLIQLLLENKAQLTDGVFRATNCEWCDKKKNKKIKSLLQYYFPASNAQTQPNAVCLGQQNIARKPERLECVRTD